MATDHGRPSPKPRPGPASCIEDVSWEDYEAQLRIIGDRHIRVNYDDERMEIMSPLSRHGESVPISSCRMVDTLTEELDISHFEAADPDHPQAARAR